MPQDKDFDVDAFMAERRKGSKTAGGPTPAEPDFDVDAFMKERRQPQRSQPRHLMQTERQEFRQRPTQPNRFNFNRPVAPQPEITPDSQFGALHESLVDQGRRGQERRQAEFAQKPLLTQWGERA